jgi:hypothetical protein
MAKTINLAEVAPGYKSGAEDFIVENRRTGNVQVISRKELEARDPNDLDSIIPKPFQGNIVDGSGDITEVYLQKEFPQMLQFFQNHNIDKPKLIYDFETPGEYWLKVDFPLPKQVVLGDGNEYTYPYEKESVLFVLNNYPDTPPIGFHIPKNSPNIQVLEKIFGTHMYDNAVLENDHVESNLEKDWHWICFHYQDNIWNFNRRDIKEGDSLSYFFHYIFYKLSGIEGLSYEQEHY